MQARSVISLSPSFNSYSNTKLANMAARVVEEFVSNEFYDDDEFYFEGEENPAATRIQEEEDSEREGGNGVVQEEGEDEGFEFAFVNGEFEFSSPIAADEIFHNGRIRPIYPVFGVEFPRENGKEEKSAACSESEKAPTIRLPLRKLFIEERETTMTMTTTSSSSSSEADELDGVPADSYCVWRPKEEAAASEGRCRKSSSTGANSKRWKLKDLLYRSHSDGSKDNFVFLSPSNSRRKKQNEERAKETPASGRKVKLATVPPPPPPPVYNRDGGEKRRSYLPYRKDLVGFFGSVYGFE